MEIQFLFIIAISLLLGIPWYRSQKNKSYDNYTADRSSTIPAKRHSHQDRFQYSHYDPYWDTIGKMSYLERELRLKEEQTREHYQFQSIVNTFIVIIIALAILWYKGVI